ALSDLAFAIPLLQYATERFWTERFVSLTGAVVSAAMEQYHINQEKYEALLKQIAASTEQRIPADFEFTLPDIGDRRRSIRVARDLAQLSFHYGSAHMASVRLAVAEERAKELGDLQLITALLENATAARSGPARRPSACAVCAMRGSRAPRPSAPSIGPAP